MVNSKMIAFSSWRENKQPTFCSKQLLKYRIKSCDYYYIFVANTVISMLKKIRAKMLLGLAVMNDRIWILAVFWSTNQHRFYAPNTQFGHLKLISRPKIQFWWNFFCCPAVIAFLDSKNSILRCTFDGRLFYGQLYRCQNAWKIAFLRVSPDPHGTPTDFRIVLV